MWTQHDSIYLWGISPAARGPRSGRLEGRTRRGNQPQWGSSCGLIPGTSSVCRHRGKRVRPGYPGIFLYKNGITTGSSGRAGRYNRVLEPLPSRARTAGESDSFIPHPSKPASPPGQRRSAKPGPKVGAQTIGLGLGRVGGVWMDCVWCLWKWMWMWRWRWMWIWFCCMSNSGQQAPSSCEAMQPASKQVKLVCKLHARTYGGARVSGQLR